MGGCGYEEAYEWDVPTFTKSNREKNVNAWLHLQNGSCVYAYRM